MEVNVPKLSTFSVFIKPPNVCRYMSSSVLFALGTGVKPLISDAILKGSDYI